MADRTRSPDVSVRLSSKSNDARPAGHREPEDTRSCALDRTRTFDDVPFGGIGPFFWEHPSRSASRPTLGISSREPSVVGPAAGPVASRISPHAMD
jgi:hypothetical protein